MARRSRRDTLLAAQDRVNSAERLLAGVEATGGPGALLDEARELEQTRTRLAAEIAAALQWEGAHANAEARKAAKAEITEARSDLQRIEGQPVHKRDGLAAARDRLKAALRTHDELAESRRQHQAQHDEWLDLPGSEVDSLLAEADGLNEAAIRMGEPPDSAAGQGDAVTETAAATYRQPASVPRRPDRPAPSAQEREGTREYNTRRRWRSWSGGWLLTSPAALGLALLATFAAAASIVNIVVAPILPFAQDVRAREVVSVGLGALAVALVGGIYKLFQRDREKNRVRCKNELRRRASEPAAAGWVTAAVRNDLIGVYGSDAFDEAIDELCASGELQPRDGSYYLVGLPESA